MALHWWEWRRAERALESWVRPLIGTRSYRLRFGPDEGSCCDFARREVVVDPRMLDPLGGAALVPRRWRGRRITTITSLEWRAARALSRHEAGHVLFTDVVPLDGPLHAELTNILEDGRIERLVGLFFPATWADFVALGRIIWEHTVLPEAATERLLTAVLLHRWDVLRARGQASRLVFDAATGERWERAIRPRVEEAWRAPSTRRVAELAREILRLLGVAAGTDLPAGLRDAAGGDAGAATDRMPHGTRAADDRPIGGDTLRTLIGSGRRLPAAELPEAEHDGEPPDADVDPSAGGALMAPYRALEAEVAPLVRRQLDLLLPPTPDTEPRASEVPGTFDVRSYVGSRGETPFVRPLDDVPAAEGLAIVLLIDRTGSMGGHPLSAEPDERDTAFHDPARPMFHARRAALLLDRACGVGGIPLSIGLAGSHPTYPVTWLRRWDTPPEAEGPKALLAGMYGAGDYERVSASLRLAEEQLALRSERQRLIIYMHDGAPTDERPSTVKATVDAVRRRGVQVVGLYVGPQHALEKLRAIFGDEHTVGVPEVAQLPQRLWTVLKRYYRR